MAAVRPDDDAFGAPLVVAPRAEHALPMVKGPLGTKHFGAVPVYFAGHVQKVTSAGRLVDRVAVCSETRLTFWDPRRRRNGIRRVIRLRDVTAAVILRLPSRELEAVLLEGVRAPSVLFRTVCKPFENSLLDYY
ncbi:hypothetical protein DIPPA_30782 [Diplonema papillatum]|nr:hypothetical protein DIPPA_30782 [Diplonema papillatum]